MAKVASFCGHGQGRFLRGIGSGTGVKSGEDGAQGRAGAARDGILNDAERQRLKVARPVAQGGSVRNPAPARRAIQPNGNELGDPLQNFGQRLGMVDVFQDLAATAFDVGKGADAAPVLAFHVQRANAKGEDHRQQEANNRDQVAHIQPRWLGDDNDVVKVAHQDIEGYLAVEGVWIFQHADAGDADECADWNLAQRCEVE